MADQDPVADYLRTVPGSDRLRAAAWDAAYATDDAEAEQRLKALQVSDEVKAKLWDLRQPTQPQPQAKGFGTQVVEGVKQVASDLNPIPMLDSLGRALIPQFVGDAIGLNTPEGGQRPGAPPSGPVNALNAILGASWEELKRAKYGAADVLEQLKAEPVQTFNQAVWQKDAGIDRLRSVSRVAPKEMAQIGRAYLEDLLGKATAQGGCDHAQGLWAQWEKLGPQTKRVLFRDPKLVSDLDKFFLGAKKMAENPNTSGTATTLMKSAEAGTWYWNPGAGATYSLSATAMAKLLRNPRAVRILSRGMSLRVGGRTAASTALTTELAGLAKANGVPLVPVTAQEPEPTPRRAETSTR